MGVTASNFSPAPSGAPFNHTLDKGLQARGGEFTIEFQKTAPHDGLGVTFRVSIESGDCDWSVIEGVVDHGQVGDLSTQGGDPVKIKVTTTREGPVDLRIEIESSDPQDPNNDLNETYQVIFEVPATQPQPQPQPTPPAGAQATAVQVTTPPPQTPNGNQPNGNSGNSGPWILGGCSALLALLVLGLALALLAVAALGGGIWAFSRGNQPPIIAPNPPTSGEQEIVVRVEYPPEPVKPKTKEVTLTGYRFSDGRACYGKDEAELLRLALDSKTLPPHTWDGPLICFDEATSADILAQLGYTQP